MKLKALDQMHVSSVQPDSLRPGQEINVSKALGDELLKKHPASFAAVDGVDAVEEKSEPSPDNKAEGAAPANKAIIGQKSKAK